LTGLTAPLIGFPPLGLITDDTPDHHLISCRLTERTQFFEFMLESGHFCFGNMAQI